MSRGGSSIAPGGAHPKGTPLMGVGEGMSPPCVGEGMSPLGREGDVTIADVGKEAAAAGGGYRGRAAAAMCSRREVAARCREGGVVVAHMGKVAVTTAWCRGETLLPCVGEGILLPGAAKAVPMSPMWGRKPSPPVGEGASHRIHLALVRKQQPPPLPLCDPGGWRVKKEEMKDS